LKSGGFITPLAGLLVVTTCKGWNGCRLFSHVYALDEVVDVDVMGSSFVDRFATLICEGKK